MRTLIPSDLHGNLAALEAVLAAEPHDRLIVLGDLVGFGPRPDACVRRVSEASAICVQGNHDLAHATGKPPGAYGPFAGLAGATQEIGRALLSPGDRSFLGALPRWLFADVGSATALLVHATPADPLHGYLDPGSREWE